METIVITGSTRGIGFGLAQAFLAKGCRVVICSRSAAGVQEAVQILRAAHGADSVWGLPCDMADAAAVQQLWDAATARFGRIGIWINNAGLSHSPLPFWEQDPEVIRSVVAANMLGAMNGSRVAVAGMMAQGGGRVFNLLGLGSNGMKVKGYALYGSTKYGVTYFTEALAQEVNGTGVKVIAVSPGMVTTDLLLGDYRKDPLGMARMKRIYTILADRVETVTPWLATQILRTHRNGARIAWLTKRKILGRFLLAPFYRRKVLNGLVDD